MYELDPPEASARKAVAASLEFGAYLRDLLAERRAPARRRPDQRPRGGRRRRRHADRDRADRRRASCSSTPATRPRSTAPGTAGGRSSGIPTALARLRAEPALMPTAIEELLRFDTPLDAVRTLGPRAGRGRRRRASRAARRSRCCSARRTATRRPSTGPDDLDLARSPNPYLSFGAGIHYCLGRAARQAGARDRVRDAAPAHPAARARRGAALEADLRPARSRGPARPGLSACATSRSATRTRSAPRCGRPSAGRTSWSRALGPAEPSARARGQPRRQRLHLGRSDRARAAGARRTSRPEFVTVLIGVNDVVRGVPPARYEANLVTILDTLTRAPAGRSDRRRHDPRLHGHPGRRGLWRPGRAARRDRRRQRDRWRASRPTRGSPFVGHLRHLLGAAIDRTLVAHDGLHPSGGSTRAGWSGSSPSSPALIGR